MIVLDSSAAVAYLAALEDGGWVEERVHEDPQLHAPHLLDIEIVSALRKLARRRLLSARRAASALDHLEALRVRRYPHLPFIVRMWELRASVTAADAAYAALAEALDATLVTLDRRLADAPGLRCRVLAP